MRYVIATLALLMLAGCSRELDDAVLGGAVIGETPLIVNALVKNDRSFCIEETGQDVQCITVGHMREMAAECYDLADAMLAERKKERSEGE